MTSLRPLTLCNPCPCRCLLIFLPSTFTSRLSAPNSQLQLPSFVDPAFGFFHSQDFPTQQAILFELAEMTDPLSSGYVYAAPATGLKNGFGGLQFQQEVGLIAEAWVPQGPTGPTHVYPFLSSHEAFSTFQRSVLSPVRVFCTVS